MKTKNQFKISEMIVLFIIILVLSACGEKHNSFSYTWSMKVPESSVKARLTFYEDGSGIKEEEYDHELYYEKFSWKSYENGILEMITGDSFWDHAKEMFRYSFSQNGHKLSLENFEGYSVTLRR